MDDKGRDNLLWAWALIDGLAACGVRHAVISPGSRSTPLALACLRHPAIESRVQVDERSAAFFALGLARSKNQPVALVCTSGSAPANWFPAVIEADMGAVPLILLTADRPPELRGCGANQAIDQIGLFGGHVRGFHELPCADAAPDMLRWLRAVAARAVDQSRWPLAGPVHVNVPLRDPLLPAGPWPELVSGPVTQVAYPSLNLAPVEIENLARQLAGGRGLIVCGGGENNAVFPSAVARLARQLACPVLADPLSGLRFGPHWHEAILACYDAFLRRPGMPRPDWVLRLGAPPVSKTLQNFLASLEDVPHIVVDASGRWPDPLHRASQVVRADGALLCERLCERVEQAAPPGWLAGFLAEEEWAAKRAAIAPPPEAEVVQAILSLLPEGGLLFSGNSMPVRELDSYSGCGSKSVSILCNRGASGIDGNVSTALGLAAGSRRPVVALLGDLTFFHDLNGLSATRGLDVVFVVLNNGGGGIFSYLPPAELAEFERAWLTPIGLDFSHAAALYGLSYQRVATVADFPRALTTALAGGAHLVEVTIDRSASVRAHRAYWGDVAGGE